MACANVVRVNDSVLIRGDGRYAATAQRLEKLLSPRFNVIRVSFRAP